MLENGKGTAKNIKQAIVLYQQAAAQGNDYAKAALTRLGAPLVPVVTLPTLTVLSPDRLSAVSGSSVTLHLQVDNPQSLALSFAASVSKGDSTRIQGLTATSSSRDFNLTVPISPSLNLQNGERFTVTLEGLTPSGQKLSPQTLELTYQKAAPSGPGKPLQKKLALVIGNKHYELGELTNPLNDAEDMRAVLTKLGFEVMSAPNYKTDDLSTDEFKSLIDAFGRKLNQQGGLGLFFYAGHGGQLQGTTYLTPINNKNFKTPIAVQTDAIPVDYILERMRRSSRV